MKTVIVSDLHLGAPNSQTKLLKQFLAVPSDRVIVNGDLIDNLDLRRFDEDDWKVLRRLEKLARHWNLLFVRGNHDYEPNVPSTKSMVSKLIGAQAFEEIPLIVGNKHYLVTHGDKFDRTLNWKRLSDAADWVYYQIQRLGSSGVWLKRAAKRLAGVLSRVPYEAAAHAKERGFDGIILGHTHHADDQVIDGVHYVNSGCWTEPVCSYVMIEDSEIKVCHWPEVK